MKSSWLKMFRSPADADAAADETADTGTRSAGQDATLYDTAGDGADEADAPGAQNEAGPGPEPDPSAADSAAWPENWRVRMADGDAKAARLLER